MMGFFVLRSVRDLQRTIWRVKTRPTGHQRGAALITAMLLAALITILAATWLARFDTHLRVTEVQRMGTQARWLLRAATDWARMIIGEDDASYDDLNEVWSVPIAPIRMTDIAGAQEAFFSGQLHDAQALYNLHNLRLWTAGGTPAQQVALQTHRAWALRLMQTQGLPTVQAQAWIARLQTVSEVDAATLQLADTLPAGLNDALRTALEAAFVWLPVRSAVNVNTVSAPVLAAFPTLDAARAQQIITTRSNASIRSQSNIANALGLSLAEAAFFDVKTSYFLATGRLAVGRIDVMARSLMQRQAGNPPRLLWSVPL
jgi:general secretion pathway protein K